MTPGAFTEALATLGWSQRHLATLLRCDTNLPTRWARGTAAIPEPIADWLETLAHAHRFHGVPDNWRRATHPVPDERLKPLERPRAPLPDDWGALRDLGRR